MASSSPNKSFVVRSAAILTNAEVKGNNLDLNTTFGYEFSFKVDFTLGSLTNVIAKLYVSQDGVTFYDLNPNGFGSNTSTITASSTLSISCYAPGWKFATVGLTGTGTVTSSSATVTAIYGRRGSQ